MRPFIAEGLSEEGRGLIARLYLQDQPFSKIQAALRAETGEEIGLASLHRYCRRKLARDPVMKVLAMHHEALSMLLSDRSGLPSSQVDLVASFAAILDLQYTRMTDKFDELIRTLRACSTRSNGLLREEIVKAVSVGLKDLSKPVSKRR